MEDTKIVKRGTNTVKIVVHYGDGTTKEITKGIVATDTVVEDDHSLLDIEFVGMSGEDVANVIYGVTEMGVQMGLFDNTEEDEVK